MAVARASASARCRGWSAAPKKPASVLSLQLGTSSAASASRARVTVSSTGGDGQRSPLLAQAAARKLTSKGALCAVSTQPWTKSRRTGSTAAAGGASATMASLMPVSSAMSAGIAWPGFTRVANSASIRPPRTRTAPISVIPAVSGDQPVVSISTTAKSRLCSVRRRSTSPGGRPPGTPRDFLPWRRPPRDRRRASSAASQVRILTLITVGRGTDTRRERPAAVSPGRRGSTRSRRAAPAHPPRTGRAVPRRDRGPRPAPRPAARRAS